MIATINGVVVSGTPQEIQEMVGLNSKVTVSSTTTHPETPPEKETSPLVVEPFDENNPGKKNVYTVKEWHEEYVEEAVAAYRERLVDKLTRAQEQVDRIANTEWDKGYNAGFRAATQTVRETE